MANELFGTDMALDDHGDLATLPAGDVEVVRGAACLVQSLRLRFGTPRGGLWGHPDYGCDVFAWIQGDDTPERRTGLEQEVESAAEDDPRVDAATADVETMNDEGVRVRIEVTPIGEATPINLVLGYGIDEVTLEVVRA